MGPVNGRPGRKLAGGALRDPVVIAVTDDDDAAAVAEHDVAVAVDIGAGGSGAATFDEGRLRKQIQSRIMRAFLTSILAISRQNG